MEAHLDNPTIEKYIAEILKLDDATKSRIIERISRSFTFRKEDAVVKKESFGTWDDREKSKIMNELFGSWKDSRTSEEIIAEIKGDNAINMEPPKI